MVMKLGIAGANGRVGQALQQAILSDARLVLAAANQRSTKLGEASNDSVTRSYTPEQLMNAADAVIDFTHPDCTLELASAAAALGKIHIIGTTGFSEDQMKLLKTYANRAVIVQSFNMSLGVNILAALVKKTAAALGEEFDIEISEFHHRHKKDAPSGTAIMLGNAAAEGRNVSLNDVERMYRKGMIGEREQGTIGFSVKRGGDVVGDHEVMFAGAGEMITLKHQGFNRDIYARGAIAAALWAKDKPAGYYSMQDVLGMN